MTVCEKIGKSSNTSESKGITGRWLAASPARCRGGEGRERFSGVLYVRLCPSPASGSSASSEPTSTSDNNPRLGHYSSRWLGADPGGLHTVYSSSGKERAKFGEMQSLYQHLISLLFVFSSLHVQQLTEGCSCALTHPQDAFCNSDIGQ